MKTTRAPSKYVEAELLKPPHAACPGCSLPLAFRYILKAIGHRMALVIPPSCAAVVTSLPQNNFKCGEEYVPILSAPLGNAASFASGFKIALEARGDGETVVIPFVGDGGTYDIGLSSLSGVAARNEDILYVCLDNELYGNTGGQTSSATPWGARTATNLSPLAQVQHKKDLIAIMAAHRIPYMATATVAFPDDLIRKAQKAKDIKGFRFLHVLTPCVAGWLFRSEQTVSIARLAVETKIFPLLEIEDGTRYTINRQPSGLPVDGFIKMQGRYKHLNEADIARYQAMVDENWRHLMWVAGYQPSGQE